VADIAEEDGFGPIQFGKSLCPFTLLLKGFGVGDTG